MINFIGARHLQTEDCRLRSALNIELRFNLPSPAWLMLHKKGRIDTYNGEIIFKNIIQRQDCLEVLRTLVASYVYFKRVFSPLIPGGFCWNCIFFETGNSYHGVAKLTEILFPVFNSNFWIFFCIFQAPLSQSLRSRYHWKDLFLLQNSSIDDANFGQRWWCQKSAPYSRQWNKGILSQNFAMYSGTSI